MKNNARTVRGIKKLVEEKAGKVRAALLQRYKERGA